MGEQAKVKQTVGLYSKVWQLPTFKMMIVRVTISIISVSIVLGLMRSSIASVDFFSALAGYATIYSIPAIVGSGLLYLGVRKEGSPLDFRRTVGAIQIAVIIWYVLGIIGGIIDFIFLTDFFETRMFMLGMGASFMLIAFLVTGMSDYHPIRNLVSALSPAVLWLLMMNIVPATWNGVPPLPLFWPISFLIIIVSSSLTVVYIFQAVSMPFERDLGINGPELLRAFGYDYLIEDPRPFEVLMNQIATLQDIPVDVVVFRSGDELISVGAILYIHPGPFRDLGSSDLPSKVITHIEEKYGVPGFVLHGCCTHHQNLTSKEDYPRIFDEIDRLIETAVVSPYVAGPFWSDEGRFKVWTLFTGNGVLAITTSAPEFTDDIALEVGMDAADKIRSQHSDVSSVAIVDAHNCIGDDAVSVMPGTNAADEYVDSVSSAVSSTIKREERPVKVGVHRTSPTSLDKKDGIGPGGFTAIVMEFADKECVFISVDGNNVEPGFREKVINLLNSQGYADVEILTTDTHVVNAISLSSKGYPPVGKHRPDEILDVIASVAAKARESVRSVDVGISLGIVKDLMTFGEKGFDTLTEDIVEAADIAKKNGLITAAITFIVALLASFLI